MQLVSEYQRTTRLAMQVKFRSADFNGWQTVHAFDLARGIADAAADAGDAVTQATQASSRSATVIISVGVAAVLLGALLALLLIRSIIQPLGALNRRLAEIADGDGDLTQRITDHGRDEVAQAGSGFNRFADRCSGWSPTSAPPPVESPAGPTSSPRSALSSPGGRGGRAGPRRRGDRRRGAEPAQARYLRDRVGVPVVDRTALILDIFAEHARTSEGRLQVELAKIAYELPRLRGAKPALSRVGGGRVAEGAGMGVRGPGEMRREIQRRHLRRRAARLRADAAELGRRRDRTHRRRVHQQVPAVAVTGYTDAGKSALRNRLSGAAVLTEDVLFAMLEPTVRR